MMTTEREKNDTCAGQHKRVTFNSLPFFPLLLLTRLEATDATEMMVPARHRISKCSSLKAHRHHNLKPHVLQNDEIFFNVKERPVSISDSISKIFVNGGEI